MPRRLAAVSSLVVFSLCLVIGGVQADNPFQTAVARALLAMAGTFVIGLILGMMAQKMLEENLSLPNKASEKQQETIGQGR